MKNKKADTKLWIFTIIGIFVVGGIILVAVVLLNQKGETIIEYGEENMNVYLTIKDSYHQTPLDGSFIITNRTSYIQGEVIKDSFSEIKNLSNNYSLEVLCKSNGFYPKKINHTFTKNEKTFNITQLTCYLDKIGSIDLNYDGFLQEGESNLKLKIKSTWTYQYPEICVVWSQGVIDVQTTKQVVEPPIRYKGLVDRCYYLNQTIKDEEIIVNFKQKSKDLNSLDYIGFIVFDNVIQFDGTLNNYYSEYNNINLGSPEDKSLEIQAV